MLPAAAWRLFAGFVFRPPTDVVRTVAARRERALHAKPARDADDSPPLPPLAARLQARVKSGVVGLPDGGAKLEAALAQRRQALRAKRDALEGRVLTYRDEGGGTVQVGARRRGSASTLAGAVRSGGAGGWRAGGPACFYHVRVPAVADSARSPRRSTAHLLCAPQHATRRPLCVRSSPWRPPRLMHLRADDSRPPRPRPLTSPCLPLAFPPSPSRGPSHQLSWPSCPARGWWPRARGCSTRTAARCPCQRPCACPSRWPPSCCGSARRSSSARSSRATSTTSSRRAGLAGGAGAGAAGAGAAAAAAGARGRRRRSGGGSSSSGRPRSGRRPRRRCAGPRPAATWPAPLPTPQPLCSHGRCGRHRQHHASLLLAPPPRSPPPPCRPSTSHHPSSFPPLRCLQLEAGGLWSFRNARGEVEGPYSVAELHALHRE